MHAGVAVVVLLAPAGSHPVADLGGRQVARGWSGCASAGCAAASNRLIWRIANTSPARGPSAMSNSTSVSASRPGVGAAVLVGVGVLGERVLVDVGGGAFAPGQGVEPGRVQVGEQRRRPAAAVEPDQHAAVVADHGAQLGDQPAQLGGQRGGRLGHHHQQRIPGGVGAPRFPPWPGRGTSTAAHGFSRSCGCPDRRAHARRHTAPPPARAGPATCRRAIAAIQSPALPAAASSPILRRIVLTSGARSNPSTRPNAGGSIRAAPSARASPSRARNTPSHNIVSSE